MLPMNSDAREAWTKIWVAAEDYRTGFHGTSQGIVISGKESVALDDYITKLQAEIRELKFWLEPMPDLDSKDDLDAELDKLAESFAASESSSRQEQPVSEMKCPECGDTKLSYSFLCP